MPAHQTGHNGHAAEEAASAAETADPVEAARAARLRYVTDRMPGIQRGRAGRGFRYTGPGGHPVRDPAVLERIKALAIPPAWTDVWISPVPNGHIQATGRDARGRKQYRYHARWRTVRDETKFDRMVAFGEALPVIHEHTARDLARHGLPREKVLATVVRLLEMTLARVGNQEYTRENGSFGLTTLRDRHVDISGSTLHFQFRGKAGKEHVVDVRDRRLARIVKQCRDIPGYELFQYLDEDGERHTIESADVNDYLRSITGQDFTAKDFRTWAGTVTAACALEEMGAFENKSQAQKNVVEAIKSVAGQLGNTPAIARKSYVHPAILESYGEGSFLEAWEACAGRVADPSDGGLRREEAVVLELLRRLSASSVESGRTA